MKRHWVYRKTLSGIHKQTTWSLTWTNSGGFTLIMAQTRGGIHRIHRSRQWNNTDGISKHRLPPYNVHYLNYNFFTYYWHITYYYIIDHPRSGVVHNFGRFCLSVCIYVYIHVYLSDDNFPKPWRIRSSYLHIRCISREYGSSSCMKVIGSRSGSQDNADNSGFITDRAINFACSMVFSGMTDEMLWPPSLSRDRKWPRLTKCMLSQAVIRKLSTALT